MTIDPDGQYDTAAAAAYLGFAKPTLNTMRPAGRGPAYHRAGRRVWYLGEDLIRYRNAQRVVTPDADRIDADAEGILVD